MGLYPKGSMDHPACGTTPVGEGEGRGGKEKGEERGERGRRGEEEEGRREREEGEGRINWE